MRKAEALPFTRNTLHLTEAQVMEGGETGNQRCDGTIRLISCPYLLVVTEVEQVGTLSSHSVWEMRKAEALPFTRTTLHLTEAQIMEGGETGNQRCDGTIRLISCPYLLVVTEVEQVGTLSSHSVWEMRKAEALPFTRTTLHLTEAQVMEGGETGNQRCDGTIRLISCPYLLVVTEVEQVGTLSSHSVWEMRKAEALPFTRTTLHLTEAQVMEGGETGNQRCDGTIRLISCPYLLVVTEVEQVGTLSSHSVWEMRKAEALPFTRTTLHLTEAQGMEGGETGNQRCDGTIRLISCPYLLVVTEVELLGSLSSHSVWEMRKAEALPFTRTTLHLTEAQGMEGGETGNQRCDGTIRLISCPYLLVVTEVEQVGSLSSHSVWEMRKAEALPFTRTTLHLTEAQGMEGGETGNQRCDGTIRLISCPYLLVVTEVEQVGSLSSHSVWEMRKAEALPFTRITLHLTEAQVNENRVLVQRLESFLATAGFYFSYTLDLTHSLQRLQNTAPDFLQAPMFERADQRFLFNKHVLYELTMHPECHRFCLPLMHGFVGIRTGLVNGKSFKLALISRRSWQRAGTRFFMRGVDREGHAANFVETEQIVESGDILTSYVQCRGSIPLFWSQKPNLRWQPQPTLRGDDQSMGYRLHLTHLQATYPGQIVLVNLINGKGREASMAKALAGVVAAAALPNVGYQYFDFHKECKELSWEKGLEQLRSILTAYRPCFSWFASRQADGSPEPRLQEGFFRTNCMDSLDRTNVVQALLAKDVLNDQLIWLRILPQGTNLASYPVFEQTFKHLWADNADACSVQYAGTGALKTDFTRFGTRTYQGMGFDLYNALTRYVKNNFADGARQDGIDLFVGSLAVEGSTAPSKVVGGLMEEWANWRGGVLLALVFAITMALLTFLLATENMGAFMVFWFLVATLLFGLIVLYGEDFVNQPKLKQD